MKHFFSIAVSIALLSSSLMFILCDSALAAGVVVVDTCKAPDVSGTAELPAGCEFRAPFDVMYAISGFAPGDMLRCNPIMHTFTSITRTPGGTLGGETEQFQAQLVFEMTGTGSYSGYTRMVSLPLMCRIDVAPRTPSTSPQSINLDFLQLQGQITGDPDFDLLRITAGTGFGLPSPGHVTLTQLPSGEWNVDSFFDITYRIDLVGAPGGTFTGKSGSTTGTIRLQQGVTLICGTVDVSPAWLSNGAVGKSYNATATASGGLAPYTFSSSGTIPPGLTLAPTGELSGIPTTTGCYSFNINVTDFLGCTGSRSYVISIWEASPANFFLSDNLLPNGTYTITDAACPIVYPFGIIFRYLTHGGFSAFVPPPTPGGTVVFPFTGSLAFELSLDGGTTWLPGNAPGNTTILVNHTHDDGTTRFFDTEMLQLDITGGTLPPGVMIRESPTLPSLGKTTIQTTTGGYMISSFFDVFTELSLDGGATWSPNTNGSTRMELPAQLYLSLPPDTIVAKDPVKHKLWKPVKRGKGFYPNWANLLDEVVAYGGFQPNASESDLAGGMLIGISHMDPATKKPIKDSAKVRCWLRLSKWDATKGVGKGYDDLRKTLVNNIFTHIDNANPSRGLDSTGVPGATKRKFLKGQLKKLDPKKTPNKLFAEILAFKFNIAASQLGQTPYGFGELMYNMAGSPFDGDTFLEISQKADDAMTYWQTVGQEYYDSLFATLHLLNRAFKGELDTTAFEAGGILKLEGKVGLAGLPFVLPSSLTPTIIPIILSTDEAGGNSNTGNGLVTAARLTGNYPNPFNPLTTVSFELIGESNVTLTVYNVIGQKVATIYNNEVLDEGEYDVEFDAGGLPSGLYFCRLSAELVDNEGQNTPGGVYTSIGKMVLLK